MIINRMVEKYRLHRNAIEFWRKKGVKIGNECEIYNTVSFGSEPYLITVGDKVRINNGVK